MRSLVPVSRRFSWPLGDFRRSMDSLLEEFFGGNGGREMAVEGFIPRTNIAETENEYEITVDLPGVKPEELNIEHRGGELWLTGERKHEKEEKGKTFHRIEKRYGRFERVIPLACPVDEANISAEYKDGVLHVTVPKAEAARPKRIEVKAV